MSRNLNVSQNFSRATLTYDDHALISHLSAEQLFNYVAQHEQNHNSPKLILEIGAGTGILTKHLLTLPGQIIVSDISYSMVNHAQNNLPSDKIEAVTVDAELPCFTACFDIIISNLTLHWFSDPKTTLLKLIGCLKPGGRLYLSCLGNHTFHEWRTLHAWAEAPCGILDFIGFGELKSWLPVIGHRHLQEDWFKTTHQDSHHFLKGLKSMGAATPHPGYKPLPLKTFKKIMNKFDKGPQEISYQILYAYYQHPLHRKEE